MRNFKYNGCIFNHGDHVTCKIQGDFIDDARISIDKTGDIYICQNVKNGDSTSDRFDYTYSWSSGHNNKPDFANGNIDVSELKHTGYDVY